MLCGHWKRFRRFPPRLAVGISRPYRNAHLPVDTSAAAAAAAAGRTSNFWPKAAVATKLSDACYSPATLLGVWWVPASEASVWQVSELLRWYRPHYRKSFLLSAEQSIPDPKKTGAIREHSGYTNMCLALKCVGGRARACVRACSWGVRSPLRKTPSISSCPFFFLLASV